MNSCSVAPFYHDITSTRSTIFPTRSSLLSSTTSSAAPFSVSTNLVANNRERREIEDDYLLVTFPLPPPSPAPTNSLKFPDFNNLLHGLKFKKFGRAKSASLLQPILPLARDKDKDEEAEEDDDDGDENVATHHSFARRAPRLLFPSQKVKPTRRKLPIVPIGQRTSKLQVSQSPDQYNNSDFRQDNERKETAQGGSRSSSCFIVKDNLLHGAGSDRGGPAEIHFAATNHNNRISPLEQGLSCDRYSICASRATAEVSTSQVASKFYSEEDNYYCPTTTTNTVANSNDLLRRGVPPNSFVCTSRAHDVESAAYQFNPRTTTLTQSTLLVKSVKFDTGASTINFHPPEQQPLRLFSSFSADRLSRCDFEWVWSFALIRHTNTERN